MIYQTWRAMLRKNEFSGFSEPFPRRASESAPVCRVLHDGFSSKQHAQNVCVQEASWQTCLDLRLLMPRLFGPVDRSQVSTSNRQLWHQYDPT